MISEHVSAHHLSRKAVIYVRQSTPNQVLTNQESTRLQYALRQRAVELGWDERDIEVIDTDLGLTARSAANRQGFTDLIGRVTLGEIGLILSWEVTRLSRNCTDWYPLLDLCGYYDCLIADRDGVYNAGTANGRLLLGLKGTISEIEMHTLRGRLTAGLLNKAERGDLALTLPAGLERDPTGVVTKDPNQEVRSRIALVFSTFLDKRSAGQTLRALLDHALMLPRRDRYGTIRWRAPTVSAIIAILKNPAYAGAFVYGRRFTTRAPLPGARPVQKPRPRPQWRVVVHDRYPAYITWETFEKIQDMLRDNYAEYDRNKTRGIPRPGAALLHGLVHCGECGHKMVVQYKAGTRYICNYLRQQHGVPVCQYLAADPIDAWVVAAFLEAIAPAELEAWEQARTAQRQAADAMTRGEAQQVERLRYQAGLAERQFNSVDPANRLVAAELERRWEAALRELRDAEDGFARRQAERSRPDAISPDLRAAFLETGRRLPALWQDPALGNERRKALLRCLIDKVVAHRCAPDRIRVRIVWRGGATSEREVEVPVGDLRRLSRAPEMEARILEMAGRGVPDDRIAATLTAEGHRSPMRDHLLPSTVKGIRLRHKLMQKRSQSHPRSIPGRLTVPQLANRLQIGCHWIYDRIHNGTIAVRRDPATKLYLFPDTPDTLDSFRRLCAGELQSLQFPDPPGC
jgi:DNA invertase Pin-like site-specific DNA recombinase